MKKYLFNESEKKEVNNRPVVDLMDSLSDPCLIIENGEIVGTEV